MERKEIRERVVEVIGRVLGLDEEVIVDDASLVEDLGADQLDFYVMVKELEDEFAISVTDEQAEKISTVGQAITCVTEMVG